MDDYGSDFMTITDEDGTEYELEILSRLEYSGKEYLAVIPAAEISDDDDEEPMEVSLLRCDEEDGEPLLSAITDEAELEAVYKLMMDQMYEDDDE